jgi:hypothetical protein
VFAHSVGEQVLEKSVHQQSVKRTIDAVLQSVTDLGVFEAEVLTPQGLRTVTLMKYSIKPKYSNSEMMPQN